MVIVTLLAYAAHHESPTTPGVSEWDACQRPLGVWNAIWVVREALTCLCAYWAWSRERKVRVMYASFSRAISLPHGLINPCYLDTDRRGDRQRMSRRRWRRSSIRGRGMRARRIIRAAVGGGRRRRNCSRSSHIHSYTIGANASHQPSCLL